MSTKVVEIVQDGHFRVAQPPQVLIVEGNSVQFSNQGASGTVLVFTRETRDVLSPTPESLVVNIAGGSSVSFEFLKPSTGPYCCQVLAEGTEPITFSCPDSQDGPILTILSSGHRGGDDKTGR